MQGPATTDIVRALGERTFLTFAGDETYLLYIQGFPLREFCAFEVFDDERAWRRMQDELLQLWEGTKFTVLFVTHSIPEAVRLGNRILLLSPHPGQVRAELNSDGTDPVDVSGQRLSDRIHRMLFAGQDVESEAVPHV